MDNEENTDVIQETYEIVPLLSSDTEEYENIRNVVLLVSDNQADFINSWALSLDGKMERLINSIESDDSVISYDDSSIILEVQNLKTELEKTNNFINILLFVFLVDFAWKHIRSWFNKTV